MLKRNNWIILYLVLYPVCILAKTGPQYLKSFYIDADIVSKVLVKSSVEKNNVAEINLGVIKNLKGSLNPGKLNLAVSNYVDSPKLDVGTFYIFLKSTSSGIRLLNKIQINDGLLNTSRYLCGSYKTYCELKDEASLERYLLK